MAVSAALIILSISAICSGFLEELSDEGFEIISRESVYYTVGTIDGHAADLPSDLTAYRGISGEECAVECVSQASCTGFSIQGNTCALTPNPWLLKAGKWEINCPQGKYYAE